MANYAIALISNIDETMVLLTWYSMLLLERRGLRNVSQGYKELRSRELVACAALIVSVCLK